MDCKTYFIIADLLPLAFAVMAALIALYILFVLFPRLKRAMKRDALTKMSDDQYKRFLSDIDDWERTEFHGGQ